MYVYPAASLFYCLCVESAECRFSFRLSLERRGGEEGKRRSGGWGGAEVGGVLSNKQANHSSVLHE